MKKTIVLVGAIVMMAVINSTLVFAATAVPGHQKAKWDTDGNGIPDAGVYVNGHYTSLYAYDQLGGWYWDLGDGRVLGNVGSPEELDPETLTVCEYVINYRADFGNDPFMNEGWIQNHITCSGYDYPHGAVFHYLIVSQTDPRYTGDPDFAVWGTWEYFGLIESGVGIIGPRQHVGGN
ncbi:MAG: hypothetical protein Q8P86_04130 [bacterium]|nr:hypothetical protein [bacterium]